MTKPFSFVRECNVFLQCSAMHSSLVIFAGCLKIITDSDLQIKHYKIEVQLKPKPHQLQRTAL